MTMYRVTDIVWETDGKKVKGLPLAIDVELDAEGYDEDEIDDAVVNRVSDDYGWLISDCTIEQVP